MRALKDHAAVVTGASSGIGKAITLGLAAQGAALCLLGRNPETLGAVAESARQSAARVLPYQIDLTIDQAVLDLAIQVEREFGGIDILVHSAGEILLGDIEAAPIVELDRQYRINVRAPCTLTKAFLPMIRARRGQIVFINSSAGLTATPGVGQYTATKHALKALADTLRLEANASAV